MNMYTDSGQAGNTCNRVTVNFKDVYQVSLIFRAIDNKDRKKILLWIEEKGESTVTELTNNLDLPSSVTSRHLMMLRKWNLVTSLKSGRKVFYAINPDRWTKLLECMKVLDS